MIPRRCICFLCSLFSCSLCLTTTPRHSKLIPTAVLLTSVRAVTVSHLNRDSDCPKWFRRRFPSSPRKCGTVLYDRQRLLPSAAVFPVHYRPIVQRHIGCNWNFRGLKWDGNLRQRVVLNVSSIPNLHSGSPQESYLWDLCRNAVCRDSAVRIRDSLPYKQSEDRIPL